MREVTQYEVQILWGQRLVNLVVDILELVSFLLRLPVFNGHHLGQRGLIQALVMGCEDHRSHPEYN